MHSVSSISLATPIPCSHRLEELKASKFLEEASMDSATLLRLQSGNGMGLEDSQMIIEGMAAQGAEPTYCMGDDIPLPVLSGRPHVMYDYFKQRFAQVALPSIMLSPFRFICSKSTLLEIQMLLFTH